MIQMNNYLKAEFDARGINEGLSRIIVSGFIMPLDPTIEQMAESVDRLVTVRVSDSGVGIEDIERARMPLFTSKPECDRSGMGFTVMESFMDTLHISSEAGAGTTVTMTKQL